MHNIVGTQSFLDLTCNTYVPKSELTMICTKCTSHDGHYTNHNTCTPRHTTCHTPPMRRRPSSGLPCSEAAPVCEGEREGDYTTKIKSRGRYQFWEGCDKSYEKHPTKEEGWWVTEDGRLCLLGGKGWGYFLSCEKTMGRVFGEAVWMTTNCVASMAVKLTGDQTLAHENVWWSRENSHLKKWRTEGKWGGFLAGQWGKPNPRVKQMTSMIIVLKGEIKLFKCFQKRKNQCP